MSGLNALSTMAVLAVVSLLAAAIPAKTAFSQNESISVSCYKGNTEEGNYIGDITVNSVFNSAQDCNQEYEQCRGQCLGCVIDSNDNQVCYDNNGYRVSQKKAKVKRPPANGPMP